jgi:2-iminobutanoate/2-iminopropanoate deaminase
LIDRISMPDRKGKGAFSPAVVAHGLCFVSGQLPLDSDGALIEGSIATQTRAALTNVEQVLVSAGSDLDRLVFVTAILADIGDWAEFDRAYRDALGLAEFPARMAYAVAGLPFGARVELQVVAAVTPADD